MNISTISKTEFWINATDVADNISFIVSEDRVDGFKAVLDKLVIVALNNGGDLPDNDPFTLYFNDDEFPGSEEELSITTKELLISPEFLGLKAIILNTESYENMKSVTIILFYSRQENERIR